MPPVNPPKFVHKNPSFKVPPRLRPGAIIDFTNHGICSNLTSAQYNYYDHYSAAMQAQAKASAPFIGSLVGQFGVIPATSVPPQPKITEETVLAAPDLALFG